MTRFPGNGASVNNNHNHNNNNNNNNNKNNNNNNRGTRASFSTTVFSSKLSDELRRFLSRTPGHRSYTERIKIKALLRKTQINRLFPGEKDHELANVVQYEHYETGRVIFFRG